MQGEGGKEQRGQVSGHSFLHKLLQKWGREESSLSLLSWHLQVPVLISGLKLTGWVCASAMADGSWLWPSHTYLLCPFSRMRFLQKGISSVSSRLSQLWAQIFRTWKVICSALCQSLCHSWCSSSPCVHQTMIPWDFLNTLSGSQAGSQEGLLVYSRVEGGGFLCLLSLASVVPATPHEACSTDQHNHAHHDTQTLFLKENLPAHVKLSKKDSIATFLLAEISKSRIWRWYSTSDVLWRRGQNKKYTYVTLSYRSERPDMLVQMWLNCPFLPGW